MRGSRLDALVAIDRLILVHLDHPGSDTSLSGFLDQRWDLTSSLFSTRLSLLQSREQGRIHLAMLLKFQLTPDR